MTADTHTVSGMGFAGRSRPDDAVLEADHLTKDFAGSETGLRALGEMSFSVRREEFLCVVGPSGCGKSTLLRLLGGLLQPTGGTVRFEGRPLEGPSPRIGFAFQSANLMPWRTVEENIRLPLELDGRSRAKARTKVEELVALVGLGGFEPNLPRELSGGMAQRVSLARALAHDPEVLLLDEPLGSLDALTRERMGAELMRIARAQRKTVLLVTHSIPEAVLLGDRVLVLTSRPGTLRLDLRVDFPRPRKATIAYTQKFGRLAERVRSAIEDAAVPR
jgi:NitT/TauT family transport system ATP-binding protein